MKILVFSHFFPPEIGAAPMRIADHAYRWVKAGHKVTVITNFPNSPSGKFYKGYTNRLYLKEEDSGIDVKRIWTFPAGKNQGKFRRIFNFITNTAGSVVAGAFEPKPDIIFATAPYLSGIPGLLSSKLHKVPLIYELRDPWVHVAIETTILKKTSLQYKLLEKIERKIIDASTELVVIGDKMATYLQKKLNLSKKPFVVHNAVDTDKQYSRKFYHKNTTLPDLPKGRFVVGSIGNMGTQYDFDVILHAAFKLSGGPYYFIFLGEGRQRNEIKDKAEKMKLDNIGFFPPVPSSEVDDWFGICDVTVVSMKKSALFDIYLPLKVLGSMYSGTPVIFGGAGETAEILSGSGAGRCFPPGDSTALAKTIKQYSSNHRLLHTEGRAGFHYIKENFNRNIMADKLLTLFESIV